jgi:hypothetical protein
MISANKLRVEQDKIIIGNGSGIGVGLTVNPYVQNNIFNKANAADLLAALGGASVAALNAALAGMDPKNPVVIAVTGDVANLSTGYANGDVVQGVTLATTNRIAFVGLTDATKNGIYVVNASGAPTRSTDADTGAELAQAYFAVSGGDNQGNQYIIPALTLTLGTDDVDVVDISGVSISYVDSQDTATLASAKKRLTVTPSAFSSAYTITDTSKDIYRLAGTGAQDVLLYASPVEGDFKRILAVTGSGALTLKDNGGTGLGVTISAGEFVDVSYNGSSWDVYQYGISI